MCGDSDRSVGKTYGMGPWTLPGKAPGFTLVAVLALPQHRRQHVIFSGSSILLRPFCSIAS